MRPLPLFVFFMFTNEKPVPRTLKTAIPEEAERGPDPAEDGSSLGPQTELRMLAHLGARFSHFQGLIHLLFTFLDEAASSFSFFSRCKRISSKRWVGT
jgi:hypothetical protein